MSGWWLQLFSVLNGRNRRNRRKASAFSLFRVFAFLLFGLFLRHRGDLAEPPRTILVVRRGARTARSSPGKEGVEYVELTDEELGLTPVRGLELLPSLHGALQSAECEFEAYRYKARSSGQAHVQQDV